MKKVLIGVGIGCGVLVLIAGIALFAGGLWVKNKAQGLVASGEQMQKQEQRAKDLDQKFAFTPPPKGQPIKLSEARVEEYLAIREGLKPVLDKFEAEGKKFEAKDKAKDVDLSDVMKAGGAMLDLMTEVRGAWLEQLEQKKMSPHEFHAITAAIMTAEMGKGVAEIEQGQRKSLTEMKTALEEQAKAEGLDDTTKEELKKQIAELDQQISALPPEGTGPTEAQQIHIANAEIVKKYKDRWEKQGNLGIDALLAGFDDANYGQAWDNAAGSIGGQGESNGEDNE